MSIPAAFLAVVLIWSTTPLAIQWSSAGGGFLFGVASRMVLGLLACLALAALLRRPLPWHRRAMETYAVAGLGVWGAMTGVYWSAQHIPSGLISVLFGLTPVVTALMAAVWLGERSLTPIRLAASALCLFGLWWIFGHGGEGSQGFSLGLMGMLTAVSVHSASSVWVKRLDAGLHPVQTTTGALLVAVPLFVLVWLAADGGAPAQVPARAAWSIVYLAVVGSALGFMLYFHLLERMQASRLALVTFISPVLALVLGQVLNGEVVSRDTTLGAGMILLGLSLFHWGDGLLRFRSGTPGAAPSARAPDGREIGSRG
jgi:drug/metabolite transporter (DMT)-like permease